jgi:hypothetical protein
MMAHFHGRGARVWLQCGGQAHHALHSWHAGTGKPVVCARALPRWLPDQPQSMLAAAHFA